jgi:cytochrome c2
MRRNSTSTSPIPGTKMISPGLKSETDRKNLIAYLATLK